MNINVSLPYWCGANRFAAMNLTSYQHGLIPVNETDLTNQSRGRKLAAEAEAASATAAALANSSELREQQRRLLQSLPQRINWVEAGKVTPVRNQVSVVGRGDVFSRGAS